MIGNHLRNKIWTSGFQYIICWQIFQIKYVYEKYTFFYIDIYSCLTIYF